jgi:GntR family transcriptional regulator
LNPPLLVFSLNFRSSIPIYLQITEQIRQMLAHGELHKGDQLPTVRQLATDLSVNFNTVARAYRLLDEAGLISTQRGRGTYIWEEPTETTIELIHQESLRDLTRRYLGETIRMGFSGQEVIAAFNEQVTEWQSGEIKPELYDEKES